MNDRGAPNVWGLPGDMAFTLHGEAEAARRLADDLLAGGIDIAYSYAKLQQQMDDAARKEMP